MLSKAFLKRISPYFSLSILAVIAYLPVITMLYALKNDIIALEYPIKFFMSDAIHNNAKPFWFNTWAMGFPLESIITWSPFSPPGFLLAALTRYNLYTLHVEFVFYIALAGCSIHYLLQKHFVADKQVCFFLSASYMLSGFCVGSSQWLLYITAASFIPLCFGMFLNLLQNPGWRRALLFTASFYIMLTSVYLAFTIIAVYILFSIGVYHSYTQFGKNKDLFKRMLRFTSFSIFLIILLSLPCVLSSIQLLNYINRGNPIAGDQHFFQTNYLHPYGLLSLISPMSVVRFNSAGTEGTMMNAYIGLLSLLLLPVAAIKAFQSRNRQCLVLLGASILFLLLSFGHLTPMRGLVNILPGFSYFRNAGLIRYFFILFLILFLGKTFRQGLPVSSDRQSARIMKFTVLSISVLLTFFLTRYTNSTGIKIQPLASAVAAINKENSLVLMAIIQLPLLLILYFFWWRNKPKLLSILVITDLLINTLICLPFFTVSSYSVKQVSQIFKNVPAYPIQTIPPAEVPVSFRSGDAIWFNTNVYSKMISLQQSYWGPLVLKSFSYSDSLKTPQAKQLVHGSSSNRITVISQKPDYVAVMVQTTQPATIYFLQNWYPGWHAYLDEKEISIETYRNNGMKVNIERGGQLEFKYEKNWLASIAYAINFIIIFIILWMTGSKYIYKRRSFRR